MEGIENVMEGIENVMEDMNCMRDIMSLVIIGDWKGA